MHTCHILTGIELSNDHHHQAEEHFHHCWRVTSWHLTANPLLCISRFTRIQRQNIPNLKLWLVVHRYKGTHGNNTVFDLKTGPPPGPPGLPYSQRLDDFKFEKKRKGKGDSRRRWKVGLHRGDGTGLSLVRNQRNPTLKKWQPAETQESVSGKRKYFLRLRFMAFFSSHTAWADSNSQQEQPAVHLPFLLAVQCKGQPMSYPSSPHGPRRAPNAGVIPDMSNPQPAASKRVFPQKHTDTKPFAAPRVWTWDQHQPLAPVHFQLSFHSLLFFWAGDSIHIKSFCVARNIVRHFYLQTEKA